MDLAILRLTPRALGPDGDAGVAEATLLLGVMPVGRGLGVEYGDVPASGSRLTRHRVSELSGVGD